MNFKNLNNIILEKGAAIKYLQSLGIEKCDSFINGPKEEDYLSPYLLDNVEEVIDILHYGFTNNKNFFVQVDSDCDGYTSSAIFINYFKTLYPDAKIDYALHNGKEHGVELPMVPVWSDIVVIPDAGRFTA